MKKSFLLVPVLLLFSLASAQSPTWSQDVAPILYAQCTSCHHSGGIGPFPLMTYNDAYTHSGLINSAITSGIMPPWPPDTAYRRFVHERILTPTQANKIKQWASGNKAQGNITLAPSQPVYNNSSSLDTVSLSIVIPTYTVSGTGDVYRNFPIHSGLAQSMYVTAVEVIPGNASIVHHVLFYQDSTNTPFTLDANDPGPGYTDAGGTGSNASVLLNGWAPGSAPYYTPVGTGFRLPANTNFVIQVHYPNGSQGSTDSTRINLKLTSVPQRNISVVPILNHITDMTNGPINIPANTTKTYYEKYTIPADMTALAVFPHMHLIGQQIKAWGNLPTTNDTLPFISIPDWNFHWQGMYSFQNALKIPRNTILNAEAYYDNTANNPNNPNSPPQAITAGEATTNEMMIVFFAYLPYQAGDTNLIIDRRVIPQGATTLCSGQSVVLQTIIGPHYTYQWFYNGGSIGGATGSSYSATQVGSYYVQITQGPNTTLSNVITVTSASVPTATVNPSGATSLCPGASLTLNAGAGMGYTYQWYNDTIPISGANSSSYSVSNAGNYSVVVYNGCYAKSSAVPVTTGGTAPSATVTPSGATTFCQGSSVSLSAPAGLNYLWSNSSTAQSITVSQGGTYTVTVTNSGNCSAVSTGTTITVNSIPVATVSNSGPTTFCAGQNVVLTGPANLSYAWSSGSTTQSITATNAGTYTLTVSNGGGCSATSIPVTVTVHSLPSANLTLGGPASFCAGGSVSLSAPAGLNYLWSNSSTAQSITATQSGTYAVTVTNSNNCTAASSGTVVTVNALPAATVTNNGPTAFCSGQSVVLTAPVNLSYGWSNGATTQSITATTSGNYTLTVTNSNSCTAVSSPVVVTVHNLPTATITPAGPTSFCSCGSVTLSATANPSYHWSNGSTAQSVTANQSGSYAVTVTDTNSCSNTATVAVQVYALPDNSVSTNKPTTICPGDSVALSAAAGLTYHWSTGATTQTIEALTNGSFGVTVSDAHSCSATSLPVTITISNNATAGITAAGATTFCNGGSVQLTATAGASYNWSNGASSQSITVNSAGNYSVTVTMSGSCTAVSNPTSVVVNQAPAAPTITPSGATTFCVGGNVSLSAPAGFTYLWSSNETAQSIQVAQSGTYTVTVTDVNTCSASSSALSIVVNSLPVVTLSMSNINVCTNLAPFALSGGSPAGGVYSGTGITGGMFDPAIASAGTDVVTYTYTDNNSCVNSATESIVVVVCTGINEPAASYIMLAPNPSDGNFYVDWSKGDVAVQHLAVYDLQGRLIYQDMVNAVGKQFISLNSAAAGCYLVQLKTSEGFVYRKITVQ